MRGCDGTILGFWSKATLGTCLSSLSLCSSFYKIALITILSRGVAESLEITYTRYRVPLVTCLLLSISSFYPSLILRLLVI